MLNKHEEEFNELVKNNHASIYRICRAYLYDVSYADDLYQDILFQLWKSVQKCISLRSTLQPCYKGRNYLRKYHDARRSFWIAPIGYVDSCIVYTRKHWSDTEHMHTPIKPFNIVELH